MTTTDDINNILKSTIIDSQVAEEKEENKECINYALLRTEPDIQTGAV
jgi:hypothetical protein